MLDNKFAGLTNRLQPGFRSCDRRNERGATRSAELTAEAFRSEVNGFLPLSSHRSAVI